MSAYDNYPPGTWAGDPLAPWNRQDDDEPDRERANHEIREGVRELYDELMSKAREGERE